MINLFLALTLLLAGLPSFAQDNRVEYAQVLEAVKKLRSQDQPNLDSVWQVVDNYLLTATDSAKAEILYQFGDYYYGVFKYDSAKLLLEESLKAWRQTNDSTDLAATLLYNGHVNYDIEDIGKAIEQYHEALNIYEDLGLKENVANAYNSIGNAYSYIVDYSLSLVNYQKGLEIYKETNDSAGVSMVYSNLAGLYTTLKDYHKAEEAYQQAYNWSQKDLLAKLDIAVGLGVIKNETRHFEEAEVKFRQAITLAKEVKNDVELAYVYQNMAFTFLETNQLDSVLFYRNLTQELVDKCSIVQLQTNIKELDHAYYYKLGEYKLAYELLEKVRNETDSFYDLDMTRQLQEVQAQYSTLKTEKEIAQKNLELEKASNELIRNELVRNYLIAGIFIVLVMVILIYRSQKLKTKANKLLLEKNQQIEDKNKEIKVIEEAKSKWFINISHELRTPLTLIKGPVRHALQSVQPNDQVYDHLRIADRNVSRLQKLVDEILDISKMESGKMPLNLRNVNLTELMINAMANFDSAAREVKVSLEMDLNPAEPILARVDEEKINNVIINLIANALKFTHTGGKITAGLTKQDDEIKIYVADTGDGIPQEDVHKIFSRFYQASNAIGKHGGTGVGLALCKEIAILHKGDLKVTSQVEKGSVFELSIPYVKVIEDSTPDSDNPSPILSLEEIDEEQGSELQSLVKGKKILIVDDNADMREYIAAFLKHDFKIIQAQDGIEALELLDKATPDLIVSDIMMPRMDGVKFAQEVKANPKWKNIPFITVSAVGDNHEKVKTLRIGIDDYMVKPFFAEELLVRIQNLIRNYSERINSTEESTEDLSQEEKLLKKLESEVYSNIDDIGFNVQRLAEIAAMSERQLYRYLKQMTGLTPATFVREIRLQRAMELIQKRTYSRTSQLSYAVGFQQPSYFSTVFKKRFGRLPAEYLED